MKTKTLPNKYHVKYDEYVEDHDNEDIYVKEFKWVAKEDEYPDEPQASLAAINLVVERQKFETPKGYSSNPQERAIRNVRVTEETRQEEVLRAVNYTQIVEQILQPARNYGEDHER